MAFYSSTDNLLNNVVLNTNSLDKGDFPSLVGLIISSNGNSMTVQTEEDLFIAKAYVFQGGNIPVNEIVQFDSVNVANGKYTSNIDAMIENLIVGAASKYLNDSTYGTGGSAAWFRIRKVEVTYSFTGAVTTPTSSVANYKLVAEVYNQD